VNATNLPSGRLPADLLADLDRRLAETDAAPTGATPRDHRRRPIHTAYIPADQFTPETCADWGNRATALVNRLGGMETLCRQVGDHSETIAERVGKKLHREPIEDLRLDFEDGYRARSDTAEDADALRAAAEVATAIATGTAPPFIGIRFKSLEPATRRRGLRTLDLFVSALAGSGPLPEGLRLTLPKVSAVSQVAAMVEVCAALERANGLPTGRLTFEVQVECPRLVLDTDGRSPLPGVVAAGGARLTGLHFGTYDYTAALGIGAGQQGLDHPVADHAKQLMQLAVAGTGVRLSDGSTNVVPEGSASDIRAAWALHARLVQRSLRNGFPQGWDLHPGQLPTRFVATYVFYRDGLVAALDRLGRYLGGIAGRTLDEPATARALARYLLDGIGCGAVDPIEVSAAIGLDETGLNRLAADLHRPLLRGGERP
jgi:citrate lyase beta subunit